MPCIGRQIVNHCATREAPKSLFRMLLKYRKGKRKSLFGFFGCQQSWTLRPLPSCPSCGKHQQVRGAGLAKLPQVNHPAGATGACSRAHFSRASLGGATGQLTGTSTRIHVLPQGPSTLEEALCKQTPTQQSKWVPLEARQCPPMVFRGEVP